MDPRAHLLPFPEDGMTLTARDGELFRFGPDPVNLEPYDYQRQLDIYGAKHSVPTARPLLEIGRDLYGPGTFAPGYDLLGKKNLIFPQLLVYGDFRVATAFNKNGNIETGVVATKLNLDVDLRLTATERIHLFGTLFDRDGQVTSAEFYKHDRTTHGELDTQQQAIINPDPVALFLEGDLARIVAGVTNRENNFDIPFTLGLIPLIFQNGIWVQDAFTGFAFTIPARNSPHLQITNMDVTFFAGFDQVTTDAIPNDHQSSIYGFNAFIEANSGYYEFGYGYVQGRGDSDDLSYHNLTAAFTRRYFHHLSNSLRVIWNFGQNPERGRETTADGVLLLVENSLISPKPLTLVPYLNGWIGFNKPQSLARAGAAGGVLLNTGLNFETDQMTGFPKLDDTGHNTWGAALGVEYLFNFDQQIVVEVAALNVFGNDDDRVAQGFQYALGVRYQKPLNNAWIFRADAMVAVRDKEDSLFGIRMEIRRKF